MIQVTFHPFDQIPDQALKFAVISARYRDQWVFCRHKQRTTWEIPGGHREPGEVISETARRELWEETGATEAALRPLAVYGVTSDGITTYGMLFFAEIGAMEPLPEAFEIRELLFSDSLPRALTYPAIQPMLFQYTQDHVQ